MRTDGVQLGADAVTAVRVTIAEVFGADALPVHPRTYKCAHHSPPHVHKTMHAKCRAAHSETLRDLTCTEP